MPVEKPEVAAILTSWVRFARSISLIQLVQIEDEIRKSIHMKVDLVTEKAVSPHIAGSIHRDEMVIFG
jgi:predicted nucleotidyltransferase